MGQVPANAQAPATCPAHYLLIGDGRLARHLRTFLTLESLSFTQWSRRSNAPLSQELISASTHVLLAVSDGAIDSVVAKYPALLTRSCVHFSGAFVSAKVPSAHPLMTFTAGETYSLETYRSIPFVLENGRGSMTSLLPGLSNLSFGIDAAKKTLYHALCAMSGNFTVLLWEKVFAEFESALKLPQEILKPYLAQTARNLLLEKKGESVLTGPLARKDFSTIEKHLAALGSDPYANIYRAFVEATLKPVSSESSLFPLGGLS